MYQIPVSKLEKIIEETQNEQLTTQQMIVEEQKLKLSILTHAERFLITALERNNTAMVAAIAEILKFY